MTIMNVTATVLAAHAWNSEGGSLIADNKSGQDPNAFILESFSTTVHSPHKFYLTIRGNRFLLDARDVITAIQAVTNLADKG